MHDYVLFIIATLVRMRMDRMIKGYRQITDAYKRLKGNQETGYDYAAYEKCYDHETKSTFDCPSRLFNALILFDVCKFINVELVTFPYKKVAGEEFFKPSYNIEVREHPWEKWEKRPRMHFIPLYLAIKRYPQEVNDFFQY